MGLRILFTKELSKENIQSQLGPDFEPYFLKVIDTQPITPQKSLVGFQNFIVTSQRAIAFVKAQRLPQTTTFFVVGNQSATALKALGYSVKIEAKNAKELAKKIIAKEPPVKVMHLCSSKALATLAQQLIPAGFKYVKNTVYATVPTFPQLNERVEALVFFSPSGVESFMQNNTLNKETLFCIGETTKTSLQHFTSQEIITSKHENLEDLLTTIKEYYHA